MKNMFLPSIYAVSALLLGMSIPYAISSGTPVTDVTTQQQIAELSKKIDNLDKSRYYLITYSKSGALNGEMRSLGNFVVTTVTPTGSVAECYGLIDHIEKQNKAFSEQHKSVYSAQDFECVSSLDMKGVEAKKETK